MLARNWVVDRATVLYRFNLEKTPLTEHHQLSDHIALRLAQRDITQKDIRYVLLHGDWHVDPAWRGGEERTRVSLSRRLIPREDLGEYGHLAGVVVVLDDKGKWLITAYKKRSLESDLRRPYTRQCGPWRLYLEDSLTS